MPSWSCSKARRCASASTAARSPPRKALEWAVQLALGLAAAHDRGIVHRDLKPENVFLTHDGRLKILDFGIARRREPATDVDRNLTTTTEPGVFIGTPAYASPEQVLGEPATPRSDLFAFGVVLHEMLTGTHPFRRETVADTMTAILRADPPPLAGAVPGVPAAALRVIDHCLEKQPSERPIVGARCRDVPRRVRQHERRCGARARASAMRARPARRSTAHSARRIVRRAPGRRGGDWGYLLTMSDRAVNAALAKDLARAQSMVARVARVAARAAAAHRAAAGVVSRAEGALRGDRRRDDSRLPASPTSSAIPERRCSSRSALRARRSAAPTRPRPSARQATVG